MIKKIILGVLALLGLAVAGFCVVVAMQPSDFKIVRTTTISAPPEKVFEQVNDFNKWDAWSPWAKIDPAMKKEISGAPSGKGAIYYWNGNDEVGEGRVHRGGDRLRIAQRERILMQHFEQRRHRVELGRQRLQALEAREAGVEVRRVGPRRDAVIPAPPRVAGVPREQHRTVGGSHHERRAPPGVARDPERPHRPVAEGRHGAIVG